MQWALDQVSSVDSIQTKTENYTTHPKYEQQRVVGWRSAQTLSLSGSDFDAIKAAVQILQSRLQIQSMAFQPSDETRRKTEDELINAALDNMKHRAQIVQENMGASGYRIMHLNIDTGHRYAGRGRVEATMMRSASVETAPAVEGGESRISVTVSGQIQLQ
jgi:predicted secreted protein